MPFDRALIKDAPDFGVGRHLSPEQELQLYHHYGLDSARSAGRSRLPLPGLGRRRRKPGPATGRRRPRSAGLPGTAA